MKKWKLKIAWVLVFVILATFAPVQNVEAKGPAKLKAKDFIFTNDKGKKEDIIKLSKEYDTFYNYYLEVIDNKDRKGNIKNIKKVTTSRKVKIGSKESYVKKQYGKTQKKKINKKEKFYKYMKYNLCENISACKSYLEYNYTKGKDKYKIRFYLDKKNKVTGIMYLKNLQNFYNYPNKEANPGLSFQAPKGKKVTTKTIDGKKVYMVPKGTKIKCKNGSLMMYMHMYDVYGKYKGIIYADDFGFIKKGKSYDLAKTINQYMVNKKGKGMINTKKLGKYLYFAVYFDDFDDMQSVAPAVYYFKFK